MKTDSYLSIILFTLFGSNAAADQNKDVLKPGQYPFQVAVEFCASHSCSVNCSATLISPSWVLTAAHCIRTDPSVTTWLILGTVTLPNTTNTRQDIGVEKFIVHPHYNPKRSPSPHDIALIKLVHAATLNEVVQPAKLPTKEDELPEEMVVTGWGVYTTTNNVSVVPPNSNNLLGTNVTVITIDECLKNLVDLLGKKAYVPLDNDINLCTLSSATITVSICNGDAGGPLSKDGVIYGVVTFTIYPCSTEEAATVYTKVSNYLSWITKYVDDL